MARSQRAQLGGVHAGGSRGDVVVHLDLPAPAAARIVVDPRARRMQQVQRAMALADGARARLTGGVIAYAAHRRVRDGARVGLITIPELLRFDVHPRADSFSFSVRNLTGLPLVGPVRELPARAHEVPGGPPVNEYELRLRAPDGRGVCIVVRVPPYLGALEAEYSAVALVG